MLIASYTYPVSDCGRVMRMYATPVPPNVLACPTYHNA